jgi:hypothetical protein
MCLTGGGAGPEVTAARFARPPADRDRVTSPSRGRSVRIDVRRGKLHLSAWTAGATLCVVGLLGTGAPVATAASAGRTYDCTTESKLSTESSTTIRYVVWCGVQHGRVTLRIRRPNGPALTGFSHLAEASGPGAAGPLRCRPQVGGRVFCVGRKRGPVTFRGSVTVPAGARCAAKVKLNVWRWTGDDLDFPAGCPKHYEERERHLGQIIRDRTESGLDLDLKGDRAAIVRRAKGLLRAWRQGNPVARWTSLEEAWGMPLTAAEQAELEYRDVYREHFQDLVEEGDWVAKNAPDTYAGYELDEAAGGIIYVGFTVEPEAMLEKLKRHLIAPDRFKPFPVTPTHSEAELNKLWNGFPPPKSPLWRLVTETHIDYLANKVEVGTEHVERVRRLIDAEYGPDAPFEVVFEKYAVLL